MIFKLLGQILIFLHCLIFWEVPTLNHNENKICHFGSRRKVIRGKSIAYASIKHVKKYNLHSFWCWKLYLKCKMSISEKLGVRTIALTKTAVSHDQTYVGREAFKTKKVINLPNLIRPPPPIKLGRLIWVWLIFLRFRGLNRG